MLPWSTCRARQRADPETSTTKVISARTPKLIAILPVEELECVGWLRSILSLLVTTCEPSATERRRRVRRVAPDDDGIRRFRNAPRVLAHGGNAEIFGVGPESFAEQTELLPARKAHCGKEFQSHMVIPA